MSDWRTGSVPGTIRKDPGRKKGRRIVWTVLVEGEDLVLERVPGPDTEQQTS